MSENYSNILAIGENVSKFLVKRSEKMSERKKCQNEKNVRTKKMPERKKCQNEKQRQNEKNVRTKKCLTVWPLSEGFKF